MGADTLRQTEAEWISEGSYSYIVQTMHLQNYVGFNAPFHSEVAGSNKYSVNQQALKLAGSVLVARLLICGVESLGHTGHTHCFEALTANTANNAHRLLSAFRRTPLDHCSFEV